jgi:hypothetical protein
MLAIAALGGLFAALKLTGAIALVVVVVIVAAVVVSLPVLLTAPGHRLRTALWVSSIYSFIIFRIIIY